jgi:hypothetical protein
MPDDPDPAAQRLVAPATQDAVPAAPQARAEAKPACIIGRRVVPSGATVCSEPVPFRRGRCRLPRKRVPCRGSRSVAGPASRSNAVSVAVGHLRQIEGAAERLSHVPQMFTYDRLNQSDRSRGASLECSAPADLWLNVRGHGRH